MKIIAVTGPPCAGKTTYIDQHKEDGDVVLDLDALAHTLGYPTPHIDHNDTAVHPAVRVALTMRASAIKHAGAVREGVTLWVIDTNGSRRLALMAARVVHLDPVEQLIEKLQDFPTYYPVMVEITVGGDLVTDVVDLEEATLTGHPDFAVILRPAPDSYDVRGLIDDGLAAREDVGP